MFGQKYLVKLAIHLKNKTKTKLLARYTACPKKKSKVTHANISWVKHDVSCSLNRSFTI